MLYVNVMLLKKCILNNNLSFLAYRKKLRKLPHHDHRDHRGHNIHYYKIKWS